VLVNRKCEHCGVGFTRNLRKDDQCRFCSRPCAFSSGVIGGWNRGIGPTAGRAQRLAERICNSCKTPGSRLPRRRYCQSCLDKRISPCTVCGSMCSPDSSTCSRECWSRAHSLALRGKKYRPIQPIKSYCGECGSVFFAKHRNAVICCRCRLRTARHKHGKKHIDRARHAGVTYVSGISAEKIFRRDNWCCQLCKCKTPERLCGTFAPNAPELDHIVPLSAGGGHTWENVQCACRKCNISKGSKVVGQLRLCI
jgi:5-methylcytosine-specific restriction endonuclease McrA